MSIRQTDPIWRNEVIRVLLKMGGYGCVVSTATNLWNRLTGSKKNPLDTLAVLRTHNGCLVDAQGNDPGDLVAWPATAKALGLVADDAVSAAANHVHHELADGTIDPNVDLVGALVDALAIGCAALRVDTNGDGKGDHTISCYARASDSGLYLCDCSALGHEIWLDANLEGGPETAWDGAKYRVVGLRPIHL